MAKLNIECSKSTIERSKLNTHTLDSATDSALLYALYAKMTHKTTGTNFDILLTAVWHSLNESTSSI